MFTILYNDIYTHGRQQLTTFSERLVASSTRMLFFGQGQAVLNGWYLFTRESWEASRTKCTARRHLPMTWVHTLITYGYRQDCAINKHSMTLDGLSYGTRLRHQYANDLWLKTRQCQQCAYLWLLVTDQTASRTLSGSHHATLPNVVHGESCLARLVQSDENVRRWHRKLFIWRVGHCCWRHQFSWKHPC